MLSKLAEEMVVDRFLNQQCSADWPTAVWHCLWLKYYRSSYQYSITRSWIKAADLNGATVRAVLFDFKKAFNLIDHPILVSKLQEYDIPEVVLSWVTDFLTEWKQRLRSAQILSLSGVWFQQVSPKGHNSGHGCFL